ncbi:MAG: M56 family metallopeptidase [Planctomycetota bacterium]
MPDIPLTIVDLPIFGVLAATGFLLAGVLAERTARDDNAPERHFVMLTAVLFAAVMLAASWITSYATRPTVTGVKLPSSGMLLMNGGVWFAVFAAGCTIVAIRLGLGTLRVAWIHARATEAPPRIRAITAQIRTDLNIHEPVRVVLSHRCQSPFVSGVVSSTIVLPADADALSHDALTAILSHELAHVLRGDTRAQLGCQAATVLLWWNPLLWVALRRINLLREIACDDIATWRNREVDDYIDLLTGFARLSRAASTGLAGIASGLLGLVSMGLAGVGLTGLGLSQIRMAQPATLSERIDAIHAETTRSTRPWPRLLPSAATRADVIWTCALSLVLLTIVDLIVLAAVTPELRVLLLMGQAY